ncbi:MAG: hypothetical protein JXN65_00795 [Clostridia bacterium]|nr:hypothetical protein [Clostridia bacterium]
MNFNVDGGYWKLGLMLLGALLAYGAGFISAKLVAEDEAKRTKVKLALKAAGFVLVLAAAILIMFLD